LASLGQIFVSIRQRLSALSFVTKAIAGTSAAVALVTALVQGYSAVDDYLARRGDFRELVKVADGQLGGGEYNAAFNSNAKALDLEPNNGVALEQRAQIAMRWLENARIGSKPDAKAFADIVDPLEEVLIRRSASVPGQELADIKAHIGWARFLRSRDGAPVPHIMDEFNEAISLDRDNMYAHVMRGFFIVWQREPVERALPDFDVALRSSIDPEFSDRMVLAALTNFDNEADRFAAIAYANKIRKSGRMIGAGSINRLLWYYEYGLSDLQYLARLSQVLPSDEHVANLDWLAKDQNADRLLTISVLGGYFLEKAGRRSEALAVYSKAVASSPGSGSRAVSLAQSGIRRLSK
jgi:tetratricopeptide (TPR) repeat protein